MERKEKWRKGNEKKGGKSEDRCDRVKSYCCHIEKQMK